ncbi:MAG TPA: DUF427 domain-containing protein [Micromonosporaceae bacterium]|nr:DUF427 domain-containing protein [Micromonosporaceae bacterium]
MAVSFLAALRRPRAERTSRRVLVRHGGATVADSTRGWRVREWPRRAAYYLPREDVSGRLTPSARRTTCPYKGVASYWDLHAGDAVVRDAAWSYEDPKPGYAELRGMVAFYPSKVDKLTVGGAG